MGMFWARPPTNVQGKKCCERHGATARLADTIGERVNGLHMMICLTLQGACDYYAEAPTISDDRSVVPFLQNGCQSQSARGLHVATAASQRLSIPMKS